MYVLEWFRGKTLIDSMFAFGEHELNDNKVKLIKKSKKEDTIYISKMNNVYDKDTLLTKITKLT